MTLKEKLIPPRLRVDTTLSQALSNSVILDPKIYGGYKHALRDAQDLFNDWYDKHVVPLFENAVVKYGTVGNAALWTGVHGPGDTHQGILIGSVTIHMGVTKEEIRHALEYKEDIHEKHTAMESILKRIEREGVRV